VGRLGIEGGQRLALKHSGSKRGELCGSGVVDCTQSGGVGGGEDWKGE